MLILTIIFYRSSSKLDVSVFFKDAKSILSPFIYGIGIAYVLNPGLKFLENKILLRFSYLQKKQVLRRSISIGTTYLILFSFLCWLISYLLPEIQQSLSDFSNYLTTFDTASLDKTLKEYIPLLDQEMIVKITSYLNTLITDFITNVPKYMQKILSSTISFASIFLNMILGIVISIYILFDKEDTEKNSKKIVKALFPNEVSKSLIGFAKEAHYTFEKFFVGKIIDSAIIGGIFFVGATLLDAPFTLLLSIIIGITNMIPFFGPFLGAIPVLFITLLFDITEPLKTIWIGVFILALQQFDGNILGPKILGDSIGVKPIGIIFSIIVAGALFGPAGMFFGVPIFAVICSVFGRFIDKLYTNKQNILDKTKKGKGDDF